VGRRAHGPDPVSRRQVEAMAAYGVPEADNRPGDRIDAKTLRRHYRDELDTGQIKATAKVAEFLFRKATTDGSQAVTAAIFWLKTRAGWKETSVHEMSGPQPVLNVTWQPSPPLLTAGKDPDQVGETQRGTCRGTEAASTRGPSSPPGRGDGRLRHPGG
jgi:hypothetical protein